MSANVRHALLAGSAFVSLFVHIPAGLAASSTANTSGSAATNTGDAGTSPGTDTAGGNGGPSIVFGSPSITLTNPSGSIQTGGAGGTGGPDTDSSGGNAGGTGGPGIQFNGQNGTSANAGDFPSLVNGGAIVGGAGGVGGVGNNSAGGAGGIGNNGVGDNAAYSNITSSGTVVGGAGGAGGNGVGSNQNGGAGGLGGGGIVVTGSNATVTVTGNVTGGAGGVGGNATGSGTNGSGGNGNTGIIIGSSTSSLTIGAGATVSGGAGGAAGTGGTGGAAGEGSTGVLITAAASLTNHGTILSGDSTQPAAILFGSLGTLTNDGTIGASNVAGPAILTEFSGTIGTFDNTGGTILSAASGGIGTVMFGNDMGNLTLTGGNIVNDDHTDNSGAALVISSNQTGTITNVSTLTADGTGVGQGFGVLFAGNATFVNAAAGTINGALAPLADQNVTLTNAGAINGTVSLTGNGDHTLTSAGGTINGAVTLAGTGANSLVLAGGQIRGTTTLDTATVTVSGDYRTGGTITATTAADTIVDAGVTFTAANAVDLGAGAFTDNGTTRVTNGGLTTTGAATIAAGGALFVGADSAVGALNNSGTVEVGTGHLLTATSAMGTGSYTFDVAAATAPASPASASSGYGRLVLTGGPVTLSAAGTSAQVAGHGFMKTGDQLQIAHGIGAATVTGGKVADNSFIYDFTLAQGGGANAGTADDAVLIVSRLSADAIATTPENLQIAKVLDAIGNGDNDPDFTAVQASLGAAPTQAKANADIVSLKPQANGGTVQAAIGSTTDSLNIAGQQLAMLRDGDATGMAAGDEANGLRGWAEGFGGHAHEDDRSGVPGYSANTAGGTAGVDSQDLFDDATVGLSFSYGHTHVDSSNDADANVDAYQATLYGTRYLTEIDRNLFIDGMVAGAYQRDDETRNDIGGVTGLNAKGNYNSWEGAGRADLGRDITLPTLGVMLTPSLMTDYTYYRSDSYSETGAGGAGLDVGAASENIWNVGAGLQATWLLRAEDGSYLKPDLRAAYKYDILNDDKLDVTSNFEAGGPAFSTNGLDPSNQTVDLGADLRFYAVSNWEIAASYDFVWKPDYTDNSGLLRVNYRF